MASTRGRPVDMVQLMWSEWSESLSAADLVMASGVTFLLATCQACLLSRFLKSFRVIYVNDRSSSALTSISFKRPPVACNPSHLPSVLLVLLLILLVRLQPILNFLAPFPRNSVL